MCYDAIGTVIIKTSSMEFNSALATVAVMVDIMNVPLFLMIYVSYIVMN